LVEQSTNGPKVLSFESIVLHYSTLRSYSKILKKPEKTC
jgi:hypothetical protein